MIEKEIFDNEEKLLRRKKSYSNIIDCLQDELAIAVMINDREFADNLHKSIWDLRDKITDITNQMNELGITN